MITTINEFKKSIIKESLGIGEQIIDDVLHVNLLTRNTNGNNDSIREKFETYKSKIKGFKDTDGTFHIGDIIEFSAGYDNDIRYTTEILGFDEDGGIYLLWDSYWFPIQNDERRTIILKN